MFRLVDLFSSQNLQRKSDEMIGKMLNLFCNCSTFKYASAHLVRYTCTAIHPLYFLSSTFLLLLRAKINQVPSFLNNLGRYITYEKPCSLFCIVQDILWFLIENL